MCYVGKLIETVDIPEDQAIIGYRAWSIGYQPHWWSTANHYTDYLFSTSQSFRWKPGKVVEGDVDFFIEGSSGKSGNGAGTHAFRTEEWLKEKYVDYLNNSTYLLTPIKTTFVTGTVKMWGKVAKHEFGYRAEFATVNSIDSIYKEENGPEKLEELQKFYGVVPTEKV